MRGNPFKVGTEPFPLHRLLGFFTPFRMTRGKVAIKEKDGTILSEKSVYFLFSLFFFPWSRSLVS
jgi:hypothetical protein